MKHIRFFEILKDLRMTVCNTIFKTYITPFSTFDYINAFIFSTTLNGVNDNQSLSYLMNDQCTRRVMYWMETAVN